MAIIPRLALPKYQERVVSLLKCRCNYQSTKYELFTCIEVPVLERENQVSLEDCIEKWLAEEKVEEWNCPSSQKSGYGLKKLSLDALPNLPIIQLKMFRKVGTQLKKFSRVSSSL